METIVRPGREEDLPRVLELIRELAAYEKMPHEVENTVERMRQDGFGPDPVYRLLVAEKNGQITGAAVLYTRYSTWKGRKLHLEDLIVTEAERGRGVGRALFEKCLEMAREGGYHSLTWQVLDWNEPAIAFYKKYSTGFDGSWIDCSLIVR